jgi:hypothetical protein
MGRAERSVRSMPRINSAGVALSSPRSTARSSQRWDPGGRWHWGGRMNPSPSHYASRHVTGTRV